MRRYQGELGLGPLPPLHGKGLLKAKQPPPPPPTVNSVIDTAQWTMTVPVYDPQIAAGPTTLGQDVRGLSRAVDESLVYMEPPPTPPIIIKQYDDNSWTAPGSAGRDGRGSGSGSGSGSNSGSGFGAGAGHSSSRMHSSSPTSGFTNFGAEELPEYPPPHLPAQLH